ncbi:hypothetical protein F5I97DRAFT_1806149 [Phlebopus sp. FC_14]|nr:hypothetical protein F5I97DRAFT_1806149 [Phlebopus sp. FC_14]
MRTPQLLRPTKPVRHNVWVSSIAPLFHVRTHASLPQTRLNPTRSIYVSNSTNPYFNLTLEDWLFRHHPTHDPLLLVYRDSPCVVIGRNQNPWKEVNLSAAKTRGIPWLRRRSGGGTVFHDLGNTNYSIHVPRTTFNRTATAQIVLRAVRALGVNAYVNDRNDICVDGKKMSYSGLCNRAYHHGTMLISTRLDTLGDLLRTDKPTMQTKGVASVWSPVCNLAQCDTDVTHRSFIDAVVRSFRQEYGIDQEVRPCLVDETSEYLEDEYFKFGIAELASWDWAYGQTPEFEYVLHRRFHWGEVTSTIRSKHGRILSCTFAFPDEHAITPRAISLVKALSRSLEGKKYGFIEDGEVIGSIENSGRHEDTQVRHEVLEWLKSEMNS